MSTRGEKNIIKTLTLSNNMQNNEVHILDRIGIITIIRIIFSSIIFKYVIEGRVYEWTITAVNMKNNNNNNGTCEADTQSRRDVIAYIKKCHATRMGKEGV